MRGRVAGGRDNSAAGVRFCVRVDDVSIDDDVFVAYNQWTLSSVL